MKYCVTTVGLPEFTMQEQAEILHRLGYDGIELRVRRISDAQRGQPPSFWGYHRNELTPENFQAKAAEIRRILDHAELQLAGIASAVSCQDTDQIQLLLKGAVAAGAPFIRVGAAASYDGTRPYRELLGETVAGFARAVELARGTGVKLVLEIHGGTIHPSASLAHCIVRHFDPTRVGVIYDPQNMVKDGFETTALALEVLGPYIAHCHVGAHRPLPGSADLSGTIPWRWEPCPLPEGLYNFPALLTGLAAAGYQGFISVEDFRDCPAEEKYADALAYLRSVAPD